MNITKNLSRTPGLAGRRHAHGSKETRKNPMAFKLQNKPHKKHSLARILKIEVHPLIVQSPSVRGSDPFP